MNDALTYSLQRLTALVLAILVTIHLGLVIYAIEGGLTTGEILSRTRASIFWPLFYAVFVLASAIHAPLGLRNILLEWTGLSRRGADIATLAFALILAIFGLRAVWAIA